MKRYILSILLVLGIAAPTLAQAGGHMLFGDVKLEETNANELKPMSLEVLLYSEGGTLTARQTIQSNGRYRFLDVRNGIYFVAIEIESVEVARVRVHVQAAFKTDFRQDIQLQWHDKATTTKPGVIYVGEHYDRSNRNQSLFRKSAAEIAKRNYAGAIPILQQIVDSDPNDFPVWEELGTLNFILKNFNKAEEAYTRALQVQPDDARTLISCGRLRIVQKNFEGAVELLSRAVKVQPTSAEANYFLGEAYLQLKLGSKAIGYLYEALRLDPIGMADAHLRLAALYNVKQLKEKAAAEYEAFLKKRPDYPDRKKLEAYIAANKKM